MKRSLSIWCVLIICAIVIFGAMAWMTRGVIRSEKNRLLAETEARANERIGLALSRMDTIGAALLVTENQRPPLHFEAFFSPEDVFTSQLGSWSVGMPLVRVSPLLVERNELVRLHFQFTADGVPTSPQVPTEMRREFAKKMVPGVSDFKEEKAALLRVISLCEFPQGRQILMDACRGDFDWGSPSASEVEVGNDVIEENRWANIQTKDQQRKYNNALQNVEKKKRSDLVQKEVNRSSFGLKMAKKEAKDVRSKENVISESFEIEPELRDEMVSMTPFQPTWMGGELFLVRLVQGTQSRRYQVVWLDQEKLREELIDQIPSDLPGIRLIPSLEDHASPLSLVSLPWHLEKDVMALVPLPKESPIFQSLIIGWIAAISALLALFFLLRGVMRLSERRAAFVSSVTHELRTPLTTFRLYSEMLADGMVTDEVQKQEYLRTMLGESERLNHLVENVLSYSQIERGNALAQKEKLAVRDLVERIRPVLFRRVDQEDAALSIELSEELGRVETDVIAVEQILFNLVDNACKYGLPNSGKGHITLTAQRKRNGLIFEVSDNGCGIARAERRRLFRAFHKSAQDAAYSKPGVGLGLALSRRLARALGGELTLTKSARSGACFQLMIPAP
ncbi:MAG: sensor histidine kinase [Akkermansiaceae bacterium]